MSEFPARPTDVDPSMSLTALAGAYLDASWRLLAAPVEPLPPDRVAAHAVAALAYGCELASRVESGRWPLAVDALAAGVPREAVAAAVGLDEFQLLIRVGVWARGQRAEGLISADRYERVVALIGEEEG